MGSFDDETVFEATNFEGQISVGSHHQDVRFVAYAGSDCKLIITPMSVCGETFIALQKCMGQPQGRLEFVALTGKSVDGVSFASEHMQLRKYSVSKDGFEIHLGTIEASVTLPRNTGASAVKVGIKLFLRGFRSYRANPVQARLGEVVVLGAKHIPALDDVCGVIFVGCPEADLHQDWYLDAEALATFVWKGLQFGHGGHLQIPLVQVYRPETISATFYNGLGEPQRLGTIYFAGQSDFVAALVARFESEDNFPEAVWTAVAWMNSDSAITEVRYLTLMTALETILDSLVPEAQTNLLPQEEFALIRDALVNTLKNLSLNSEALGILTSQIKQINRSTFSTKINALIKKYHLPSNVFDVAKIRRLIKARNNLVHKGQSLDVDLWECSIFVQEMISLLVLAELRYAGPHQSFIEGSDQTNVF